eukprot:7385182-Prymnesium_polylepis.1
MSGATGRHAVAQCTCHAASALGAKTRSRSSPATCSTLVRAEPVPPANRISPSTSSASATSPVRICTIVALCPCSAVNCAARPCPSRAVAPLREQSKSAFARACARNVAERKPKPPSPPVITDVVPSTSSA